MLVLHGGEDGVVPAHAPSMPDRRTLLEHLLGNHDVVDSFTEAVATVSGDDHIRACLSKLRERRCVVKDGCCTLERQQGR
jgi:hypothetical protein